MDTKKKQITIVIFFAVIVGFGCSNNLAPSNAPDGIAKPGCGELNKTECKQIKTKLTELFFTEKSLGVTSTSIFSTLDSIANGNVDEAKSLINCYELGWTADKCIRNVTAFAKAHKEYYDNEIAIEKKSEEAKVQKEKQEAEKKKAMGY